MATITIGGDAQLAGQLPTPARLPGEVISGTVNLVLNPDLESSVVGVDGWAGTSVALAWQTDFFFEGAAGASAAFTAGAGARSVTISCVSGLGWTGQLETVLGSLYLRGAFAGLTLALRVQYADGSSVTGEAIDVDTTDPNKWIRVTCAVELDSAKSVNTFFLVLSRATGTVGGTLYLDAAQVELDSGWGVTHMASGRFGLPYHYWVGQPHRSASVRDDVPADTRLLGSEGEYQITWTMWRADASFRLIEDMSPYVISASVTGDRNRQLAWTMTCRMMEAGYARLRPWVDWLVPVLYRTDDQGRVRSGFLGHYVVLPSPATHSEHMGEYDIDCRSAEYLLSRQAFKGKIVVGKGDHLSKTAEWVINSASLGTSNIRARTQLVHPNHRAEEKYEFSREQSKLQIANELLEAAVMQPVWTSRIGVFHSFRTDTDRYETMQPVKLWAENFVPPVSGLGKVRNLASQIPAETQQVSGTIRRVPQLKEAENQILVYTIDPRRAPVKARFVISDPTNPVGITWAGRWRNKSFAYRMVPNNAAALQIARAMAKEVSTRIDQVELAVIPDPQPELLDQIVYLAIYRIDGFPVAVGRFRVLKIGYSFSAQNALMTMTLGFVHGVAELQGGDAVSYFDARNGTWINDVGQAIELNIQ